MTTISEVFYCSFRLSEPSNSGVYLAYIPTWPGRSSGTQWPHVAGSSRPDGSLHSQAHPCGPCCLARQCPGHLHGVLHPVHAPRPAHRASHPLPDEEEREIVNDQYCPLRDDDGSDFALGGRELGLKRRSRRGREGLGRGVDEWLPSVPWLDQ